MICTSCDKDAITFHGVSTVTHGYCHEHRCCAKCGGRINHDEHSTRCTCKDGPTERPTVKEVAHG